MDSFRSVDSACRAVQEVAMPIIAAIEGYAVGAGLELAAACDFRLASTTARLGITAAKLAITPGRGHITRLRNVIGTAHSLDLLLTGRLVSANEAYAMGLVTEVVPSEDSVLSRAQALGETLASRAPGSLRWIKQTIYGAQGTLTDDPDADAQEATQCFATEDFREAVQAFRGKRPPVFTGH
jgi:enoyl-CoA hydratase/carnithine racemase